MGPTKKPSQCDECSQALLPTTIRATLWHKVAAKIFIVEQGCCAQGGHLSAIRRQLRGSGWPEVAQKGARNGGWGSRQGEVNKYQNQINPHEDKKVLVHIKGV